MRRVTAAVLTATLTLGACTSGDPEPDAAGAQQDATGDDATTSPVERAAALLSRSELDILRPEVEDTSIAELSAQHRFAVGSRTDTARQTRAAGWLLGADDRWAPSDLPAPPDAVEHGASGVIERDDETLVVHGWGNDARGVSFPVIWTGTPGDWVVASFPDLADDTWSAGVTEGVEHQGRVVLAGSRWRTDEVVARLWELVDGGLVEIDTGLGNDPARLSSIATDGDTLIVMGYPGVYEVDEPTFLLVGEEPEALDRRDVEDIGQRRLDDITAAGDGVWILGGRVPGSSSGQLGLWRGAPGAWTRVAADLSGGTESIGDLRRTGNRLIASGTHVWVSDDAGRTWREVSRPFAQGGWVTGSEMLDGRLVSAGRFRGGPDVVRQHVDGAWLDAPATPEAWNQLNGKRTWAGIGLGIPGDDGAVVFAGLENITVGSGSVTRQLASYRYADGVWQSARLRSRGYVGGLVHTDETGFVMVGTSETDQDRWAGMTVHVSADGTTWTRRSTGEARGRDHRGHAAVVTDRGVVALGMGWEGDIPFAFGYRTLDGDTFATLPMEGLEDRGLVSACGAGSRVLAKVNDAEGTYEFALSEDSGDTWRVLEDGPAVGEHNFGCDRVGDEIVVTTSPPGEDQTLHRLEVDGSWTDVTPTGLGDDHSVNEIVHDEATGTWTLVATVGDAVRRAVLAVSDDFDTWHVVPLEADAEDGDDVSAWEIVLAGGVLHAIGSTEGRDLHWTATYAGLLEALGLV